MKILIFLSLIILFYNQLFSQTGTAKFNDGTRVRVEVINSDPDKARRSSIYNGFFGIEGLHLMGISYYQPKVFFVNALFGYNCASLEMNYLFYNTQRTVNKGNPVDNEYRGGNMRATYVVKIPTPVRTSFGLHFGTGNVDYTKRGSSDNMRFNPFSTMNVFGGLSVLEAVQHHWKLFTQYGVSKGTTVRRLNADVIYYFNRKVLSPNESDKDDIDEFSREIGYRIYFDFRTTMFGVYERLIFNGLIGVGVNSNKVGLPIILGGGLGYCF